MMLKFYREILVGKRFQVSGHNVSARRQSDMAWLSLWGSPCW